jgi:hypothetical protein
MTDMQRKILNLFATTPTFSDESRGACQAALDEIAAKNTEITTLRTALSEAGMLLNEIRARDGTAYHDQMYTNGMRTPYRQEEEFERLVELIRETLGGDILKAFWATHNNQPN